MYDRRDRHKQYGLVGRMIEHMHQATGRTEVIGDEHTQQHVTTLPDAVPGKQTPCIMLAQCGEGCKNQR